MADPKTNDTTEEGAESSTMDDQKKLRKAKMMKKLVKVITVMFYLMAVCGGGTLLSLYYIIFWDPDIDVPFPPEHMNQRYRRSYDIPSDVPEEYLAGTESEILLPGYPKSKDQRSPYSDLPHPKRYPEDGIRTEFPPVSVNQRLRSGTQPPATYYDYGPPKGRYQLDKEFSRRRYLEELYKYHGRNTKSDTLLNSHSRSGKQSERNHRSLTKRNAAQTSKRSLSQYLRHFQRL